MMSLADNAVIVVVLVIVFLVSLAVTTLVENAYLQLAIILGAALLVGNGVIWWSNRNH